MKTLNDNIKELSVDVTLKTEEIKVLQEELNEMQAKLLQQKNAKRLLKNKHYISNHALLRYIERIKGFDVEELRKELMTDAVENAIALGASKIKINNMHLVIENGVIVTIY